MDLFRLCDKFLALIQQSQGDLILLKNNENYSFKQYKTHTLGQIQQFEQTYNLTLPNDYRYFLQKIGACKLYVDEHELGIEFYALDKILDCMAEVLATREALQFLPNMIFIGSNLNNGGIIVLNLTKAEAENLTIFYSDDDLEEWLKLDNKYIALTKFLEKLYNSYGEDYYL